MEWNFDLSKAPRGHTKIIVGKVKGVEYLREIWVPDQIIAAGSEGVVTLSHWNTKRQAWSMFTEDCPPIAWMPFPKHPHDEGDDGAEDFTR